MIYVKDFFEVWETSKLMDMIDPNKGILKHGNDGVIYTVNDCPYYPGTCEEIVKWKPPHFNSIDFEF